MEKAEANQHLIELPHPIPHIPLAELWRRRHPGGFLNGWFMVIAHMDESYDSNIFALSALCAQGSTWDAIEQEWLDMLNETNIRQAEQGRPPITRYHATDCNTYNGEFEDWTLVDVRLLHEKICYIIESHTLFRFGIAVERAGLRRKFPIDAPKGQSESVEIIRAHHLWAFINLLRQVDNYFKQYNLKDKISVVHDHTSYNGTLLDAFDVERQAYGHESRFRNFVTENWQDCISLQPADFMAFEVRKFGESRGLKRKTIARICQPGKAGRILYYKQADQPFR